MNPASRLLAIVLAALLAPALLGSRLAGSGTGEEKELDNPVQAFAKLKPGMTPEEVNNILRVPPKLISRQILYHRYHEQWLYEMAVPIRLTFDCRRGQMPQLLSVPKLPIDNHAKRGEAKFG